MDDVRVNRAEHFGPGTHCDPGSNDFFQGMPMNTRAIAALAALSFLSVTASATDFPRDFSTEFNAIHQVREGNFVAAGTDIDDASGAVQSEHMARRRLRAKKATFQVCGDHAIPFLFGEIEKRFPRLASGIIYMNGQGRKLVRDFGEHTFDITRLADIRLNNQRAATELTDFFSGQFRSCAVGLIVHDDIGPRGRKRNCNASAVDFIGNAFCFIFSLPKKLVSAPVAKTNTS